MKKLYLPVLLCSAVPLMAQQSLSGHVITEENSIPLKGAIVTIQPSKTVVLTD